jgi:tRNA threonylcarbamoyladenosine biosynthesis protein TsaE
MREVGGVPSRGDGFTVNDPIRRRSFTSESEEATVALGSALGVAAAPGLILLLEGDLGSGKTTLVRGLAAGLEVTDPVTSPTFTLMNDYRGRLPLYHFDAWMEGRERSFLGDGGAEELGGEGVCAIEWGERVAEFLPEPLLHLRLAHLGVEARSVTVEVVGEGPAAELLACLLDELPEIPGLTEVER